MIGKLVTFSLLDVPKNAMLQSENIKRNMPELSNICKASIEEVNDDIEESEIEDEVDVETKKDIYLQVLEYICMVQMR